MNSIGKMRYRVQLQSPTNTTDAGGGRSQTWSRKADLYANIIPKSGSESYKQGKIKDETTHEIHIRHRSDMSAKYRIVYESRVFNIKSILNTHERDRFMVLSCTEGLAT
jgi:SPP1 family predicted phage head-tail adaptor